LGAILGMYLRKLTQLTTQNGVCMKKTYGGAAVKLGFIFVLGAVFKDTGEFEVIEHAPFDGCFTVHFVHLE